MKLSQQIPRGSPGPCFQVLVFSKNPRLYEGWATYIQNKAGTLRKIRGLLVGKGTKDPHPKPADQWEDVARPDLMGHTAQGDAQKLNPLIPEPCSKDSLDAMKVN